MDLFFSHLPERKRVMSFGFLPDGFHPKLLESLLKKEGNDHNWETSNIYSNGATFEIGFNRDILLIICSEGSTIRLKVRTLPDAKSENLDADISGIRNQFEQEMKHLLETKFDDLHCYVCASPCHHSSELDFQNYSCLQILGRIGEVGNKKLPYVRCPEHKNTLPSDSYEGWFYNECTHRTNQGFLCKSDQKILNEIANRVIDETMLRNIMLELGVDANAIEIAKTNSKGNINDASFKVLFYDWYNNCTVGGNLQQGSLKYDMLKRALDKAKLNFFPGYKPG